MRLTAPRIGTAGRIQYGLIGGQTLTGTRGNDVITGTGTAGTVGVAGAADAPDITTHPAGSAGGSGGSGGTLGAGGVGNSGTVTGGASTDTTVLADGAIPLQRNETECLPTATGFGTA